ncbi:titin [Astyanax mexicanus]|uniref:titin n=1 Tax=Astyanax mexicanus TaxID=7994 RepID=UPI0020CAC9AC|nr:titin [Astyanax mexicanus]
MYRISPVRESDSGEYTCRGKETKTSRYSKPSSAVRLTVSDLPRASLTVDPDSTVFTGESVTLKCEITGNWGWRYQWYKGSSQITTFTYKKHTLIISSAADQDQYWCRGERDNRPRSSQNSNKVTLTVREIPTAVVTINPANQVFSGERVTLRCDLQGGGGFEWTYSWYKKGNPDSPFSSTQEYEISSVEYSHSGEYFCRGTVRETQRYSHTSTAVTLTVSERPKPVVTINPANRVFRGESVTLRCDLHGGGGFEWTYSWYKKGNPVSPFSSTQDYEISSVSDSHSGEYSCRGTVRETQRHSHTSTAVRLTVSDLPRASLTVDPDSTVFTGESVTLKCEITGNWEWRYQWYKGSSQITTFTYKKRSFTISSAADQDQYWCRGERDNRPRSSQNSNKVTLTVRDVPTPTLTVAPASTVFTGESVTLKCEITGYDGWSYQWYKRNNGGEWSAVYQSVYYTVNSNTLTIREDAVINGDQYRCRGELSNRPSSQYSNSVTLTVKDLPRAFFGILDVYVPTPTLTVDPDSTVFTGESVTLTCEITGYDGWRYQWFYKKNNGGEWSAVPRYEYYTVNSNTLTIRKDAVINGYQYRCRGELSNRPSSQYSNSVTLTVKGLPTPTLTVAPDSPVFTGESVTLKCEITGYDGWSYQWFYKKNNWGDNWYAVPRYEYNTVNSNTITIREDAVINGDQYRCRGEQSNRPTSSQYSNSVTLTVKDVPTPTLTVAPDSTVFTGEEDAVINGDQYRCRGELSNRPSSQYSNSVTLTVQALPRATLTVDPDSTMFTGESVTLKCEITEKPKPELTSSLNGAALIGNPVTLYCNLKQSAGWRFYWFKHTQTPESETTTDTHSSYTIRPVNVSDGGQYWCRAGRGDPVYYTHYSDALWVNVTALSPPVSLIVSPSRSQHFTTDSLLLICEEQSSSTGWRVRRYSLSESKVSECSSGWGSVTGSTCNISSHYTNDTGVYWCESESGGSSSAVNITVHNGSVILESPVHPVTEGDPLTLHCLYRDPKSSDLTADFYKDGLLLQTQTTGEMIIPTVSKSDEGLYHCKIPEKGESPQSWISVRDSTSSNISPVVLALGLSLTLFLIIMLCVFFCYKKKKKGNQKDASVSSVQNQNPGAIPLQAGNDHIYDDVGAKENNNTEDTEANASEVTYTQVKFSKKKLKGKDDSETDASDVTYAQVTPKKKPKGKDKEATEPSDVTYSLIQMKTLTPCSEDEANPGPSDANPGPSDANPGPSDVVYSQIQIKPKKPKVKDVKAEPSDVTYAEIDLKDKKNLKENENKLQKDADAGPSDVTYAEIDLKDKTKTKKKPPVPPKGKGCAASNTVYSELKQNLQRP